MTLRIVSLVPSLTELCFALGLGDALVGRTRYCVHPADRVGDVPKVGGTKDPKLDRIRALRPTHVLLNVDENPKAVAEALSAFVPHVVVTHPLGPRDNLALYAQLADLFDIHEAANALAARFEAAWASVPPAPVSRPVAYMIWRDPWMTVSADTYIGRLLQAVGLEPVAPLDGPRYPELELATLGATTEVLLSSEPFPFKQKHVDALLQTHPTLAGRVHLVDGELFSWYGSRAPEGVRYAVALAAGLASPQRTA